MKGLAFHCHHDTLVEYVYDYEERVKVIKQTKPKDEQELRLRLFKMIPDELLPKKGLATYLKTGDAYYRARDAYDSAWDACHSAWDAYDKAWYAYDKAWDAYYTNNKTTLEKLHAKLYPDCPWNGETIFTRKDDKGNWY